jgi:hypothetical protein
VLFGQDFLCLIFNTWLELLDIWTCDDMLLYYSNSQHLFYVYVLSLYITVCKLLDHSFGLNTYTRMSGIYRPYNHLILDMDLLIQVYHVHMHISSSKDIV